MENKKKTYLKTIPFSEFNLWDVKRYNHLMSYDFENAVLLRDILNQYKVKISKDELIENDWKIISKINFQGQLFLRKKEEIQTYKGSLNKVPENSIIYSKINVRHGCVYYHEKGKDAFGVSTEYPTFLFDQTKINGYYLKMLLRSSEFKRLLNTKTSGISKARVKVDEFLDIKIPLPPLSEQNRIVENYNTKIKLAQKQEKQAEQLDIDIENYFSKELGITINPKKEETLLFHTVSYKELSRWALSYLFKNKLYSIDNVRYRILPIKSVITFFEGGKTPSTSRKDFWNGDIFWTSAKDMKELFLTNAQDKITKEAKMKIYPKGTILGVFRSGILRHSFPVTLTKIETSINQDLKAIGVDEALIDKKYFLFYLKTYQKLILERAQKFGVTVESINSYEFLEVPIVLPPLIKQNQISSNVSLLLSNIKVLKTKAEQNRKNAIEEFEQEIFTKN